MTVAVPPTTGVLVIGEPSFADALRAIETAIDLDDSTKRYWSTSLRQLAGYLGLPRETIPARIAAISGLVRKLHPERLGVNSKTFANHRANAKAALRWFNRQTLGSARHAPMSEEFRLLLNQVADRHVRDTLSPFFRYLTGLGVSAEAVTDAHVAAYAQYRRDTGFQKFKLHKERLLVRYWNTCRDSVPGWPKITLTEPARLKSHEGPAWADFPVGLRKDIEQYCARLAKPHESRDGRLMKACDPSTIEVRKRVLEATVRMAVSIGIPLAELQSLGDLLRPDRAEAIIDAYWKRNGKLPSTSTIDLGDRFFNIARTETDLSPEELGKLDGMRRILESHRSAGLTPKNRAVVRDVLLSGQWGKVVQLPGRLMAQADASRKTSPVTSAVMAQLAIAIRILVVAPVRMENLSEIEIGTHLVRPGGPGEGYFLTFERYDVKNDIALDFELDDLTSELIDRYIMNHRPVLMRGRNHNCLFPGVAENGKGSGTFGLQISKKLWDCLGIALTPHQFRHCAAALLLQRYPGNYELVRQVLGHKSLRTTIAFYVGLETIGSTRLFGALVTELDGPLQHSAAVTVRRHGRRG